MTTVALWDFQEIADSIRPVDAADNLNDLTDDQVTVPALNLPPVVTSEITGRGRQFDGVDEGMIATELVADSVRLTRSMTIRCFLRYRLDNASGTDIGTIVARGENSSAAERLLWGVEIERVSASTATLRARWAEIGGAEATVAGVLFTLDSSKFFELAVIREWVDTTTVNLTYLINGEVIGTEVVAEGDIGEGFGGTVIVGAAHDGATVYDRFVPTDTIIDSLSVENDAMSPEEIRQDFRRITIHQPNGYVVLRGYIPPGKTWSADPDSRVQKWIASEGDGLGYAFSQAEKLREDILPDRAYNEMLVQWEGLTGLAAGPSQSVADRRTAVLSFLRKTLGFPVADIKTALELAFGLDSSDIEIFEFTGLRTDDFSTDDIGSPPSPTWITSQGIGTVAIAAGVCTVTAAISTDGRFPSGAPNRLTGVTGRTSVDSTDGSALITKVELQTWGTATDQIAGHIWKAINGDFVVIGFRHNDGASNRRIFYVESIGGVLGTPVDISGATVASPAYLFTRYNSAAATFTIEFETLRASLDGIGTDQATLLVEPRYAGFGIVGLDDSLLQASDVDFDDAEIWEPNSPRGFIFIAFRDPAFGGTFNLSLAQQQLDKQKPAHTLGVAIDDKQGFTLGPTGVGRLGLDPLFPSGI